jgi:hypothetical protein
VVYRELLQCAGTYWVVQGLAVVYRELLQCAGTYWGVQGPAVVYRELLQCAGTIASTVLQQVLSVVTPQVHASLRNLSQFYPIRTVL